MNIEYVDDTPDPTVSQVDETDLLEAGEILEYPPL
jgi:hypothetical protein